MGGSCGHGQHAGSASDARTYSCACDRLRVGVLGERELCQLMSALTVFCKSTHLLPSGSAQAALGDELAALRQENSMFSARRLHPTRSRPTRTRGDARRSLPAPAGYPRRPAAPGARVAASGHRPAASAGRPSAAARAAASPRRGRCTVVAYTSLRWFDSPSSPDQYAATRRQAAHRGRLAHLPGEPGGLICAEMRTQ